MFTGIIEKVGTVQTLQPTAGGKQVRIDIGPLIDGTKLGDSICVNGVCLTVTSMHTSAACFDISGETLKRSTLGSLTAGAKVNLERALQAGGRFGGHYVQGHIDGTGTIKNIRKQADFSEFHFEAPKQLLDQIIEKGSVAIDGISLTVAALDSTGFSVALIPATIGATTWQYSKIGDTVNIETDILIKTIQKTVQSMLGKESGLTIEKLQSMGY